MKVLVIERDGFPSFSYIVADGFDPRDLHTRGDETVVRYVPEQSARESAQGEGSVTLTREQLRDNAAAAWDAGYMAHREGRQRHNPYQGAPPKAEGKP